jgi:hypothetical protein
MIKINSMIWRNVIKGIIKASLLPIILPVIIIGVVIAIFGFTLESLVAVLTLGELYIVLAQLEVALRQTRLSMLEYEPELKVEVEKKMGGAIYYIEPKSSYFFNLRLVNKGEHLARNVFVSIDVKEKKEENKFIPFSDIGSNEVKDLCVFREDLFNNNTITVDVDYENILGEFSGIYFIKYPNFPFFITVKPLKTPGPLLNSIEELALIYQLFTLPRRARKLREKMEK